MATLQENTIQAVRNRTNWLKDVVDAAIRVRDLPEAIKELKGEADCNNGELDITLYGGSLSQLVCECEGAVFEKPEFSSYTGKFSVTGYLGEIRIKIYDVDKPADCVIRKEKYEATRFVSSCSEKAVV